MSRMNKATTVISIISILISVLTLFIILNK